MRKANQSSLHACVYRCGPAMTAHCHAGFFLHHNLTSKHGRFPTQLSAHSFVSEEQINQPVWQRQILCTSVNFRDGRKRIIWLSLFNGWFAQWLTAVCCWRRVGCWTCSQELCTDSGIGAVVIEETRKEAVLCLDKSSRLVDSSYTEMTDRGVVMKKINAIWCV
jgi:hypothetical protein